MQRDGKHYCRQHDPEAKAARRQKQNEKWDAEHAARVQTRRLEESAPALLAALELLLRDIEPIEQAAGVRTASGDAARAALAMARGGV